MRRIKTIGLVAAAVLALTAVIGAASASAAYFNSEITTTTVKSSAPYGLQNWKFKSSEQGCDAPQVQGTVNITSKVFSPTAGNAKCYYNFSAAPNLEMNGCSFVYRLGAKTGTNTFNGAIDIACPVGKTVAFTGGSLTCKVNVPAQKNLSATFENVGAGTGRSIKVTVNATGLNHTQVSGTDCGGFLGSFSNGAWNGSWKLEGSNGFGSPIGIWVSPSEGLELPPSGIAIAGSPLALTAGTYPMSIAGAQGTQHTITLGGKTVKCTTANLSTSVSGPTAQFSVNGEYSGCTALGFPGQVKMNGCTYTFNVLNQPPYETTYAGHGDISCPAGKSIEIVASGAGLVKCTVTIGTQITSDQGWLTYTNESATSTIGLGLSITGIDYHQQEGSGVGRCTTGDFTDGTYTGTSTLVGSY